METIPIAVPRVGREEADAVHAQIVSGWISMGRKVAELEERICAYTGAAHAVAMCNGTATLHAALRAVGVGPGDEVVVPTLSYVSSANAVLYCGAKPVFCEVSPQTFNVTPQTMRAALTDRTKAVMPVDLKGLPVDYDACNAFAAEHGLAVVLDSAESFGAKYKGRVVGNQCALHSFSFFANKSLTMGEGGVITTDDPELAKACRVFRNQGQSERYVHVAIGHNYRLTDMAAAFGLVQLSRVEGILAEKVELARRYDAAFAGQPLVRTPVVPDYADRPSWYMYCLLLDPGVDQAVFLATLRAHGVDYRLSFPPIHLQPVYRELFGFGDGDYPVSEDIYRRFVDIPCWAGMTDGQVARVVEATLAGVAAGAAGAR